jgi:acyl carrier protein
MPTEDDDSGYVAPLSLATINRTVVAELLQSDDTYLTTLSILASLVHPEADTCDPVEIFVALREEFSVEPSLSAQNKINAWQLSVGTPLFYTSKQAFVSVVRTIATGFPTDSLDAVVGDIYNPTLADILWAQYEIGLQADVDLPFNNDIKRMVIDVAEGDADDVSKEDNITLANHIVDQWRADLQKELASLGLKDFEL